MHSLLTCFVTGKQPVIIKLLSSCYPLLLKLHVTWHHEYLRWYSLTGTTFLCVHALSFTGGNG